MIVKTYINGDSWKSKSQDRWLVAWNVSEELVPILVPLDGIKPFFVKFKVTLETNVLTAYHVLRNHQFQHPQSVYFCKQNQQNKL